VENYLPILAIFTLTTAFGIWYRRSRGRVKLSPTSSQRLSRLDLGSDLGSRMTFLQFSSAFCSPCRATRALLTDVVADFQDVTYIDIDAEKHLGLVRRLKINSTPTTLILDRDGVEIGRAVGAPKRGDILATIKSIG
jgi:thiol-disulfide isomerase/thioredoxin